MNPELAKALVEAAKVIKNPVKDSKNPFFKSEYASLGTVIDGIKGELLERGITIVQQCKATSNPGIRVLTTLIHSSGETYSVECYVPLKGNTPQDGMGAFTYGRRYALLALFNLAAEDDDGNQASGKSENAVLMQEAAKNVTSILNAKKGKL